MSFTFAGVFLHALYAERNIDLGMTFGGYLGLTVLVGAFAAVGILASAVSSNQIMAYLSGVFMCFILYFGIEQLASYKLLGGVDYILQNFGFYYHYTAFTRGLVDTQDAAYFVLVMVLCLGLAAFFVERKK